MINWEVIMWCCITISVLVVIVVALYYIFSARLVKKKRTEIVQLHDELKVGKEVIFVGGIKGKVVKIKENFVDVEVAKDVVITISRFCINNIL